MVSCRVKDRKRERKKKKEQEIKKRNKRQSVRESKGAKERGGERETYFCFMWAFPSLVLD